ncbi:MAG: endonuclease/exonuclease/phosphatase family protein, partial [Pirellulaceae bacterium]
MSLIIANEASVCTGPPSTRVMDYSGGTRVETTIDYVFVSKTLFTHIMNMEIFEDRMGSDHKPILVKFRLSPTQGRGATTREVWQVENIPEYLDFVDTYQTAFSEWLENAKAHVEACSYDNIDHTSVADLLENSFQLCLDDVSDKQIGHTLIGPSSSPMMTKEIKHLNNQRLKFERALRKVMCGNSTQKDRDHMVHRYRQAKAAALKASAARREEIESDMFHDIEKNHSNSKLLWS